MPVEGSSETPPVFSERPTGLVAPDGIRISGVLLAVAGLCALAGLAPLAWSSLALAAFIGFFFRNPLREIRGEENYVVAPADGRVVEAGEIELPDGAKALRVPTVASWRRVRSSFRTGPRRCGWGSFCRSSTCT
jgi:hypothetical protein